MAVTWHWVCIEDEDLGYILDGPDEDLEAWIDNVQSIVEDGLETA